MPAWLPFLASAASAPAGPQSSSPATTTLASLGLATLAALLAARLLRAFYNVARIAAGLRSVPLAPDHHPLLGHALGLLKGCYWDTMEAWWRAGRTESAPLVQMVIGHRRMVVAGSAEAAREVFQTKVRAFAKDLDFSFKPFLPILGTGLVTASGALWQSQRLLIAPALRVDVLEVVPGIAVRAAERLCAKLRAAVEKAERDGSSPPVVDMEEEFRLLTLQVIGEAILSLPPEECDAVFPELYLPVMEEANLRALRPWRALVPGTRAGAAYKRGIARLDDYITRLLRARWAARSKNSNNGNADGSSPVYTDILERMLASIAARGEAWSPALETQLCFDVKTFLLAGHETSAAMLTWTLYELCCGGGVDGGEGTEALAAVRAEAAAVLGVSGGGAPTPPAATVPTREDAETRMETSLACLKESLRKYTVVPVVTRVVAADGVSLCGVPVPRGTYVAMLAQAVHKGRWADPGAWRPSRFSPGGEYESFPESIRPFTYVPFIQGPRNCLGQYFALLEARIVLARVLGEFDFVKATPGVPRRHPAVIPTGPEGGMPMRVSVRGSGGK
jgi:cytochrome P450